MTIWETSDAHPRHFRLKLHKSVPPTRLDWINPCFRSHTHRNTHRMYAHANAQTQFFAHHNEWINCATSCQKLHIFDMSLNLILTDGLLSFEFQFWIFNGLYWLYLLYRHWESDFNWQKGWTQFKALAFTPFPNLTYKLHNPLKSSFVAILLFFSNNPIWSFKHYDLVHRSFVSHNNHIPLAFRVSLSMMVTGTAAIWWSWWLWLVWLCLRTQLLFPKIRPRFGVNTMWCIGDRDLGGECAQWDSTLCMMHGGDLTPIIWPGEGLVPEISEFSPSWNLRCCELTS